MSCLSRPALSLIMERLAWWQRGDLILCADDVARGFPWPDLVLTAVLRLGIGDVRDVAVVTATVGSGAEVMADGCVHVYGALRGRAMAGAHGDVNARVFCQEFHAELVSIAGVFRVFETLPEGLVGRPVQAWLAGDDLLFARVG